MQPKKSSSDEISKLKLSSEDISKLKSSPEEVGETKSKSSVNFSKNVEESQSKIVGKIEKYKHCLKKVEENQVKRVNDAQEKSEKSKVEESCIEKSQKIMVKTGRCQGCGSNLNVTDSSQRLDKVKLFEHVHASGRPNYQGCRIPVCQATMNLSLWRERLKGYKDSAVCDLLQFGFPLDFDRNKVLSSSARTQSQRSA